MSKLAAAGLSSTVAGPAAAGADRERVAGERVGPPNGLVEVGRPLRGGQAGRPEGRLEGRPGLADQDRGDRALGHDRGEARQVDALVPAAGDEHDRRLEGAQRGDHRVGLGPLRVVDEAHAVDQATGSSRCSTPLKAAAAARIASGSTPNASATATAASAFDTLCAPGMASSAVGMIRPSAGSSTPPPPASGQALDAGRRRSSRRRRRARRAAARRAGTGSSAPGRRSAYAATIGSSALSTSAPSGSTSSASRRLTRR